MLNSIKEILKTKNKNREDGFYIGIESRYNEYLENPTYVNLSKLRYELTLVTPKDIIIDAIAEIDNLQKEYETIAELSSNVYHAEDIIDGGYSIGMYGDKYKEVDNLHTKVLEILREYDKLLQNTLK